MLNLIKRLSIIIFLILTFVLINKSKINYDEYEINYLSENYTNLDINLQNFELIKADLTDTTAFIAAEIHGIETNYKVKYHLFSYLYNNAGVRFLLLEISYSSGYLLNEYVQTGNMELLDKVFSFYQGTRFWTKEEYQFYQNLYQFNANLPEDEKITLVGIDVEHSSDSYYYLKSLEQLDNSLVYFLDNNYQSQNIFYHNYLFDWQFREDKMLENYLFLAGILKIDKFFGQFGMMHCFKSVVNDFESFAYLMQKTEKVMVIMTIYKNSQYISEYKINNTNYYLNNKITNYLPSSFDYFASANIVLFKLNNSTSPYKTNLIWFFENYKITDDNTVTVDYFDYILFINRAKASQPLKQQLFNLNH